MTKDSKYKSLYEKILGFPLNSDNQKPYGEIKTNSNFGSLVNK